MHLSRNWPDLSSSAEKAEPIKRLRGTEIVLPPNPGKEPAKMKPRKTVNPVRKYAVGSVITALLLLSPVVALLMVSAAEMLIDVLIAGGASAVCAVAASGFGLVLVRKSWRRPAVILQGELEPVPGETSIAGAPM
jgi:hypothetical protein